MRTTVRILSILSLLTLFASPPTPISAKTSVVFLPGFPRLRQQHSLTCESSAASMGTHGTLTEGQIMAVIPRNPNPNLGFRGNPDGLQGKKLVDYGVYAVPIHQALLRFHFRSDVLMYGTDGLLATYIDRGWPVVVWITYGLQATRPRLAEANGAQFFLVPHEHAVLVVGYDYYHVYANDPWTGRRVSYLWGNFNRAWGYFGNMALAMESCAAPDAVTGLKVSSLTAAAITWTWDPAANAAGYQVTVIRHGVRDRTVYQGTVTTPSMTLATPSPKVGYEISVQSISSCGGVSSVNRLWVQMPSSLSTPTPSVTPGEGTVTPQPGTTVTSTPQVQPTAVSTVTAGPGPTASATRAP